MDNEFIKMFGDTTTGALVVTLLWFLRAGYKKYAYRNVIHVIKLINGKYAVKTRRGIGFEHWLKWRESTFTYHIIQRDTKEDIIDCAKDELAHYGVGKADRVEVVTTGFTEEEPSL